MKLSPSPLNRPRIPLVTELRRDHDDISVLLPAQWRRETLIVPPFVSPVTPIRIPSTSGHAGQTETAAASIMPILQCKGPFFLSFLFFSASWRRRSKKRRGGNREKTDFNAKKSDPRSRKDAKEKGGGGGGGPAVLYCSFCQMCAANARNAFVLSRSSSSGSVARFYLFRCTAETTCTKTRPRLSLRRSREYCEQCGQIWRSSAEI